MQPVSLQGFGLIAKQFGCSCLLSAQTAQALLSTIIVALALTAAFVYFGQAVKNADARL